MTALPFPVSSADVRLSERQHVAIRALVAGRSIAQAAGSAGVTPRTLLRWRGEPAFSDALRVARDAAFADALDELRRVAGDSVRTCERLLKPANKPEVRLGAAKALLGLALRVHEAVTIEERLRVLEARLPK